jgi:hypothetical protein
MTNLELYDSLEEGSVQHLAALHTQLSGLSATEIATFQHPVSGNTFLYASVLSGQVDVVAMVMGFTPTDSIDVSNEVIQNSFATLMSYADDIFCHRRE